MFLRIVLGSLRRRGRRKLAALVAIALGTGAATGLFQIFLSVGDGVAAEYRANRHNILVEPAVEGGYLREADLGRIRQMKWRNQIVSYAPILPVDVETDRGPATLVGTWWGALDPGTWKVEGTWSDDGAFAGGRLGWKIGDVIRVSGREIPVRGIVTTGEEWDDRVIVSLRVAQEISGLEGCVRSVHVRAITTPDSEIVKLFHKDPKALSPRDYEQLICTPFATTIAMELTEKIPNAEARPVRRVTETEGRLIEKVDTVLLALALASMLAGAIGVMSAMTATIVERRQEIGLLKALGATDGEVAWIFVAETALLAVAGSALGCLIGWGGAQLLGSWLLGRPVPLSAGIVVLALGASLIVALGGMVAPLRHVLRLEPTKVLHEA